MKNYWLHGSPCTTTASLANDEIGSLETNDPRVVQCWKWNGQPVTRDHAVALAKKVFDSLTDHNVYEQLLSDKGLDEAFEVVAKALGGSRRYELRKTR
jgi:hypothetical protein